MILVPVFYPNQQSVDTGFVNGRLPWRVMSRRDQVDWTPLASIARNCGLNSPRISFLGLGPGFSPPEFAHPWCLRAAQTRRATLDYPEVERLWWHEQGPLDWEQVMRAAAQTDLVVTAPQLSGSDPEEIRNNEHNAEFARRLARDPRFQGPLHLRVGRFAPVEVVVFLKSALHYSPGQGAGEKGPERLGN
jgi:hypothetical protein